MAVTQETTPVIKMTAEADQLSGIENVNYLHWVTTDSEPGDELEVLDASDNVLWYDYADGTYCSKLHILKHPIDRLKIATIDAGELYVIKEPPGNWNT